jgi:hypothetical protein
MPWLDKSKSPEERAKLVLAKMTPEEKFLMTTGKVLPYSGSVMGI